MHKPNKLHELKIIANLSSGHHYGFTNMNSHIYMFHADKDIGPRILSRDTMA
jgi:hypothetical protein